MSYEKAFFGRGPLRGAGDSGATIVPMEREGEGRRGNRSQRGIERGVERGREGERKGRKRVERARGEEGERERERERVVI